MTEEQRKMIKELAKLLLVCGDKIEGYSIQFPPQNVDRLTIKLQLNEPLWESTPPDTPQEPTF